MSFTPAELREKFRGAVVGFAVGDALGFPLRGAPPVARARLMSLGEDFAPQPRGRYVKGQFSDDTQLLLAVIESIIAEQRVDGRSIAAHVAHLWREEIILQPPLSLNVVAERLLQGVPWMSAGAPLGERGAAALSRAVAVGLWDAALPNKLAHDAALATVVTHKDAQCSAAAAAYAKAVALMLDKQRWSAQAFCDALAAEAARIEPQLADELSHLPRTLTWDVNHALDTLRRVGVPPAQLGAPGVPAHVVPVLLTALFIVLKVPTDLRDALRLALRLGGEVDVLAGLVGGLWGAAWGVAEIPPRLRKNVMYGDHLIKAADRLFDARQAVEGVRLATAGLRARKA